MKIPGSKEIEEYLCHPKFYIPIIKLRVVLHVEEYRVTWYCRDRGGIFPNMDFEYRMDW